MVPGLMFSNILKLLLLKSDRCFVFSLITYFQSEGSLCKYIVRYIVRSDFGGLKSGWKEEEIDLMVVISARFHTVELDTGQ